MVEDATHPLTGAAWRKSSYSNAQGAECVEAAPLAARVGVRDSKNPDGPVLVVGARQWKPFLSRAKGGI